MSKKLSFLCVFILIVIALLSMTFSLEVAYADNVPVLLLSGKPEGNEIVVTATLRDNDGISGMLLKLEYDRDLLTLTGFEQGEALSTLDVIASGSYSVYPFRISWSGDDNDDSNGKLLTLHFTAKNDASGKAFVKFSYERNQDINYYEGGELVTRNLITDTLHIDLASGEAIDFVSENSETENNVAEEKEDKTALIVGLSVGIPIGVAMIVGIPLFAVKNKKIKDIKKKNIKEKKIKK